MRPVIPALHHPRSRRRRLTVLLAATVAVLLPALVAGSAAAAPARHDTGARIEPLAAYQPQRICAPVLRPGTAGFARMVLQSYPGTSSAGIVRSCTVGGRSEHKEGRAWDWRVSAYSATGRAQVHDLAVWLFATDRWGHRDAMVRRLGIQYIIWNHYIWSSDQAARGWRPYTGANPHTDHVHFSFTWDGASARTSYWTGRVATATPPAAGGYRLVRGVTPLSALVPESADATD